MVHVFAIGGFSDELRLKDGLRGMGHFFSTSRIRPNKLARRLTVAPVFRRCSASRMATLSSTRLCSSPTALTDGRYALRSHRSRIPYFPGHLPNKCPLPSHPLDLADSRIGHAGLQLENHAVAHNDMPCPCTAIMSTLMFSLSIAEPYPDLRRALFLAAVTAAHCQALRHGRP